MAIFSIVDVYPFDRAKPHLSRWGRKRGSEPALSEVEGMNLKEAPAFRPGSREVHFSSSTSSKGAGNQMIGWAL